MRRWVLALLALSLAISDYAGAFQGVSGSGAVGTIPVWKTNTTTLGDTSPIDGTASKNLFIAGPTPWIDFTAAGGMGDAQTNTTASMTASMAGLTTTSGPAFAAGDAGKVVGVLGAGLGAATVTGTTTIGSTGSLVCGNTYQYKITYVAEDSTTHAFLSESQPTASTGVTVTGGGCSGSDGSITFSGYNTTNGTGYRVYFASTAGRETLQPLSGCTTLTTGGNACLKTSSYTLTSDVLDGPLPPTVSVLVTSIATYNSATSVTLAHTAIQSVSNTTIMWGTDNTGTWNTVLNTCNGTGRGCQIFFPGGTGVTGSSTATGDYLTLSGFTNLTSGGTSVPGIVLRGGGNGIAGTFGGCLPSAEIVGVSRVALLSVGKPGVTTTGLEVETLGFRDPFGGPSVNAVGQYIAPGELYGGLSLLNADHFYLSRTSFVNFGGGYGLQLDTEPITNRQTQIGSINDAYCVSCLVGISVPYDASDVDINGGRFEGTSPLVASNTTNVAASIGLDLEANQAPSHTPLGNIRVRGGAVVNFNYGAWINNCEGCTIVQDKFERTGTSTWDSSSTAIYIDGTSTTNCFDNQAVSDIIAGFPNGFSVNPSPDNGNCTRTAIALPAITNVSGTPISDNGTNSIELNNLTNSGAKPGLQLSSTGHITSSAANNSVAGTCMLNCTPGFTPNFNGAPVCTASDQTNANPVKVAPTNAHVALTGTSGDMVAWICVGNPN